MPSPSPLLALGLLAALLAAPCSCAPRPDRSGEARSAAAASGRQGMVPELQPLAKEMAHEVLRFWHDHGPDPEHGGFHGTLDRRWGAWGDGGD